MRRLLLPFVLALFLIAFSAGCGTRVFISDTRVRGTVPPPEELAAEATAAAERLANATPTASAREEVSVEEITRDLESRVGEDLVAAYAFSGRETPNSGPLRGMRLEVGDSIRISAGRSQDVVSIAGDYCVDTEAGEVCSRAWVHGRPAGGSLGAWYPISIFDYELDQ